MSRGRYVDPTIPRGVAQSDSQTDNVNPTDTTSVDLAYTVTDNSNPTDELVDSETNLESLSDDANPTDEVTTDLLETGDGQELVSLSEVLTITRTVSPVDDTGNTDTTTFDRSVSTEDAEGLTDLAAKNFGLVPPVDSEGLTDTTPLNFTKGIVDTEGTSDTKTFNRILGRVDNTGLTDIATPTNVLPTVAYSRPFTYDVGWRDVINIVDKIVEQRVLQDFDVVWSSDLIYNIPVSSTLTIKAVAESDPFTDAITPVEGVRDSSLDFEVTPEDADYILEDGDVTVTLSRTSGQSVDILVNNASGSVVANISNLRLRARPVRVARAVRMLNKDIDSVDVNGPKSFTEDIGWANFNDVFALSEIVLNQRFKRLPVVHFEVNNGDAIRLREAFEVRLSDRIRIVNFNTATDNDFFVEQVQHRIEQAGNVHRTVIGCEQIPVPVEGGFTFDDEVLGKFDTGKFGDRSNTFNFEGGRLFILGQSTLNGDEVLGL